MMEVSAVCRESLAGGGKSPHSLNPMQDAAQYTLEEAGADTARLVLSGPLTLAHIGAIEPELKRITGPLGMRDTAFWVKPEQQARLAGVSAAVE